MVTLSKCLAAAAAAAAVMSCSNGMCKVEGSVEDAESLENKEVYFISSRTEIDTVAVVDGKFSYSCAIDDSRMINVLCVFENKPRGKRFSAMFVPESRKIGISLGPESKVTGSPLSDKYGEFQQKTVSYRAAHDYDGFVEYCKLAYKENCQTVVGEKIFQNIARELPLEEFDEYMAMGTENLRNNPSYEKLRRDMVAADATRVGTSFVDFNGVTPDGKSVSLSDFVGKSKLTLVDFWASWCGPCMRSMPGMVSLWKKYHSKGLGIVGVAVWDGDNSASRIKIDEKGMLWPQIFVGEDKTATDSYGIQGIPHVILIDAEGRILLRGIPNEEELDSKISGLL